MVSRGRIDRSRIWGLRCTHRVQERVKLRGKVTQLPRTGTELGFEIRTVKVKIYRHNWVSCFS